MSVAAYNCVLNDSSKVSLLEQCAHMVYSSCEHLIKHNTEAILITATCRGLSRKSNSADEPHIDVNIAAEQCRAELYSIISQHVKYKVHQASHAPALHQRTYTFYA